MSSCWVCGAPGALAWRAGAHQRPLRPEDLAITDSRYGTTLALVRCSGCGFVFADDAALEQVDDLVALYGDLDDPGYHESAEPRRVQMEALVDVARAARPAARSLLDVGAASGLLVAAAADRGLHAVGVEPSTALAQRARAAGLDVRTGTLPMPSLDDERFDLVLLVDVVEHVTDPVGLLRDAAAQIAPGGAMVIVTPDLGSLAARLLRGRWWHLRLAHVGYFDRATLQQAVERAGLRVERWSRPTWWFRVDYLLERLGRYVPGPAWLARRLARSERGRRLAARTVRLDLRDSLLVVARP